jgi:cobalt-precorrin 5A hydrolase
MRDREALTLSLSHRGESMLETPFTLGKRASKSTPSPDGRGDSNSAPSSHGETAGVRGASPPREKRDSDPAPLISVLATLDRSALNAIIAEAAREAGLEAIFFPLDALKAVASHCITHSEKSVQTYGVPSVAEAAALAAVGRGARLLIPRFCGRNTTASVAA